MAARCSQLPVNPDFEKRTSFTDAPSSVDDYKLEPARFICRFRGGHPFFPGDEHVSTFYSMLRNIINVYIIRNYIDM